MGDAEDRELIAQACAAKAWVELVVSGCAYTCCGRGFRRRDGYEQTYQGRVVSTTEDGLRLENPGAGSTYVVLAAFDEVEDVRYAP